MKTPIRCVLFLIFILAGTLRAGEPRDYAEVVPENSLFHLGWVGSENLDQVYSGTAFAKILKDPRREQFCNEILRAIQAGLARVSAGNPQLQSRIQAGMDLFQSLVRHPGAFTIFDFNGPIFQIAMMSEMGEGAPKFVAQMDQLFAAAGLPEARPVEARGHDMRQMALPIPGGVYYGHVSGHVVLAMGLPTLNRLLDGLEGKGTSLAASERLAEPRKQIGGGPYAAFTLFADVQGILDRLLVLLPLAGNPAIIEAVPQALDFYGLSGIQTVTCEARSMGEGCLKGFYVKFRPDWEPVQVPALQPGDLKIVPADCNWAWVGQVDMADRFDQIQNAMRTIQPGNLPGGPEAAFQKFEEQIGLHPGKDLMQLVRGSVTLFDSPANGGLIFTGITLAFDSTDGSRLAENLAKLVQAIASEEDQLQIKIEKTSYEAHPLYMVRILGEPIPVVPSWGVHGNKIVVGLLPQTVMASLDRLDGKAGQGILANPQVKASLERLGGMGVDFSYANTKRGLQAVYPLLALGWATATGAPELSFLKLDPAALPPPGALVEPLFDRVATTRILPEGRLSLSYGSLPVEIPLVEGAGLGSIAMVSMVAAIVLPAIMSARGRAMDTADNQKLKQIGLAVIQFEQDRGRSPDTLDDVLPYLRGNKGVFFSTMDRDQRDYSFIYIPMERQHMDRPDRTVLAYRRMDLQTRGRVPVVFWDGHVETVSLQELEQLMLRGVEEPK